MKIKYDNLINELFVRFPMLKNEYEKEGDYIEGLPHLAYSIVFVPFIRQACLVGDEDKIRLICDIMEYMATSEDKKVQEVLAASVLESMLSEREVINSLKRYLRTYTLRLLSIMEKESGWD